MMSINAVVLVVVLVACRVNGYGEVDQNGHPNWQERANHLLVNAVRVDPANYKATFMGTGFNFPSSGILSSTSYPAVNPVYLTNGLCRSSYNHSLDMATFTPECFQHATCGSNQDTFVRIRQFCNCGTLGENIAAGKAGPLETNNQWLCDVNSTSKICAEDKKGNDGHRKSIMSSSYTAIGIGYAYTSTSTYKYYWTQDFSNCLTLGDGTYNSPIYGGSHYVVSSTTKFSAAWYNSAAPSNPSVVIAGTSTALTLEFGTSTRGIYTFSTSSANLCAQYYFQFGSTRFPDTGFLVVVGSGCTDAWVAGSPTTVAPTTAVPTTVATTAAPTTAAPTTVIATTAAPTTVATTTAAPTTAATTRAPSTASPTTAATTRAPSTAAPTTAAPTTTRPPSTAAPTTRPLTTAAPTTRPPTTAAPGGYFLCTSSVQNSWTAYQNPTSTVTNAVFLGQNALKVTLGAKTTSTKFFWFTHSTPVYSTAYTSLKFNIASSGSNNIDFYFNYEYTGSVATTSSAYTAVSKPFSEMLQPGHTELGTSGHELVFSNPSSSAVTIYLYNVQFV